MFKVLTKGCEPTKGSKHSACVDLYASEDCVIGAGETGIVGLGVCIDMDMLSKELFEVSYSYILKSHNEILQDDMSRFLSKHYLQLNPRSSLRAKGLLSHTGIIDMDYPDEIKIIIHNPISNYSKVHALTNDWSKGNELNFVGIHKISKGDRIAQITLVEHKGYLLGVETEDERTGGIGSTDD